LTTWKLAALERDIPSEVLEQFKTVEEGDEFLIDPEYLRLFQIWKSWFEQSKKPNVPQSSAASVFQSNTAGKFEN
jgi:hypothetical protein